MYRTLIRSSFAALAFFVLITANTVAQTTSPSGTTPAAPKTKVQEPASKTGQQKDVRKDEFQKHLNEIQLKVNDYTTKAGTANNQEFSAESDKLASMANVFKAILNRYDNLPADRRDQYFESLTKEWGAITDQQKKVAGIWDKMNPSKGETAPKTVPEKQVEQK
jgi:hypothetical protein